MKKQVSIIKDRVEKLLREFPHFRDDDHRLILAVWNEDIALTGNDPNQMHYSTFVNLFVRGLLSNPESIRRTRQKLQQDYPGLRGKAKEQRDAKQDEIKSELGYYGMKKLF